MRLSRSKGQEEQKAYKNWEMNEGIESQANERKGKRKRKKKNQEGG